MARLTERNILDIVAMIYSIDKSESILVTRKNCRHLLDYIEQLLTTHEQSIRADERGRAIKEFAEYMVADLKNGVEYNKKNYGKDEITETQVYSYIAFWREKLQKNNLSEGGK